MCSSEEVIRELKEELNAAREIMKEKDEKITRLSLMLKTADSDLHELTEKLFQEAYNMVNQEKAKVELSEKLQMESKMKVYVLQAEADALKLLVATTGVGFDQNHNSSPLHQMKKESRPLFGRIFGSSKTKSSFDNASPLNKSKSSSLISSSVEKEDNVSEEKSKADHIAEIDPILFREFCSWMNNGHPINSKPSNEFLMRIVHEDILPCMNFENAKLAEEILAGIRVNSLEIEPINESDMTKKTCILSNEYRLCPYQLRTSESAVWITISLLVRNRIAAVCDFFTYLRYLSLGIIKGDLKDCYYEIITLRKNMALARLGLDFVPRSTQRGSVSD